MAKKIINTQAGLEKKIKEMKKKKAGDPGKTKLNLFYGILLAFLVVYVIALCFPLIWSFLKSIQSVSDYDKNLLFFPAELDWNYGYVFQFFTVKVDAPGGGSIEVGMVQMYIFTILYSVGCSFTAILIPCLTSYVAGRFNYAFNKVLITTVIVVMIVPIVGATPAALDMSNRLGLYDNIWGLWVHTATFLGSNFLIFLTMWRGIPKDFTEAAKVDGASNLRILIQIMLPLARNTFFTLMLLAFIGYWNDYNTPLLYLPSYPTAALGLFRMTHGTQNEMSMIPRRMASAMTLLIPMLIVFCIFQKRLVGNLSMGGVKG